MERVLYFTYPFEYKAEMEKLKSVLTENNIEFICPVITHMNLLYENQERGGMICINL